MYLSKLIKSKGQKVTTKPELHSQKTNQNATQNGKGYQESIHNWRNKHVRTLNTLTEM